MDAKAPTPSYTATGKLLVVQNKGGGHGTIGFELCRQLKSAHPELSVVMLQDKCNRRKEPFDAYDQLTAMGVEIVEEEVSSSFLIVASLTPLMIHAVAGCGQVGVLAPWLHSLRRLRLHRGQLVQEARERRPLHRRR